MSISQEAFKSYRGQAYEGMASDIGLNDIPTVHNFSGEQIGYGLFIIGADLPTDPDSGEVIARFANQAGALPKAAFETGDLLGVTVRTMANEQAAFADKSPMSVMRYGRVFVKCMDGCTRRDSVHVSFDSSLGFGRVYGAEQAGKTIETKAMFLSSANAGDLVEIQLNGIM